jgi:hypothetical protein
MGDRGDTGDDHFVFHHIVHDFVSGRNEALIPQ